MEWSGFDSSLESSVCLFSSSVFSVFSSFSVSPFTGEGGVLGEGEAWVSTELCNPTMTVINAMLSEGAPCEDGERLMLCERGRAISTRTCDA